MGTGPKCEGCSLERLGSGFTQPEIGARYTQTRLLLVGEASGESEARDSLPFRPYAQSGSLLSDALRECNISRAEVAITNQLRCRPPKDWLEGAPWEYTAKLHCTTSYLEPLIAELKPRVILALGGTAFRALVAAPKGRQGTLDYIRGYAMPGAGVATGIPVIGTYHPAFLRRGASHLTPLLQRDLRRAFLIATGKLREGEHFVLYPLDYRGGYLTQPSITEAWSWARNLSDGAIYCDIETPRSRREDEDERNSFADRDINMVQFSQHRGCGIALPFRDEYIDVIRHVLALSNRKVGHNWFGFDLPVLAANGIEVNGEQDDTMLQFHHYHPDLPMNLQAAAQFCGFPFAYKHLNETEPEFYGCCDVDATCWVDETMTALLKRDGLYDSYQRYVRDFWPILRDMSKRGLPISDPRRLALKVVIGEESVKVDAAVRAIVPVEVLGQKQKNGYKNPPILKCEECDYEGRGDHICNGEVAGRKYDGDCESVGLGDQAGSVSLRAISYAALAESHGLVYRAVTIGEDEKCRCLKKSRPTCAVCHGVGVIPAGTVEQHWATPVEFNPNSPHQVKRFMRYMKHPVPKHAKRTDVSGEASETTEVKELERLFAKTKHPIYPLLIDKRQLTKVESVYVDGWKPGLDGRLRSTFTFKPATFQTSSREPNVQNGLKHADPVKYPAKHKMAKAFAAMQCAEDGHLMVNIDAKSFHAQTTACEFGLPDYLRLAKIDIHSFVTCHYLKLPERVGLIDRPDEEMREIFKQLKKDDHFKFVRDFKAKRTILGIQFAMWYRKLYQLNRDDFDNEGEAKKLWELIMVELFPGLKRGQDSVRALAAEQKMLQNKFGGVRRFYDVVRWDRKQQKMVGGDQAEAAVAFLPASNAFGYMRDFMHRIREHGWDEKYQLVNSVHDSVLMHCPKALVGECVDDLTRELSKPSSILVYPGVAPLGLSVEAEASVGPDLANMAEYHN